MRGVRRRVTDAVVNPRPLLPPWARRRLRDPRVGLVGFFHWGNYGDELFVEVYREHLSGMTVQPVFERTVRPFTTRPLQAVVRRTDALVIGGGDIVIPWNADSAYWSREFLARPVFVAGVGVPKWRPPQRVALRRLRSFFQHRNVRFVNARDVESKNWLEHHLEPRVPVVLSPDLVCALTLPPVVRPADPPILGVVVRRRTRPDDFTHIERLCTRATELGYRVRKIVLANRQTRQRDLEATQELVVPGSELVTSEDLDDLTRAVGECSVLASMKFHGLVVATMYGVPTLSLAGTDKNRNFLRRIGRPDLDTRHDDPELADRLAGGLPPIDPATVLDLRREATGMLADLRARLVEV